MIMMVDNLDVQCIDKTYRYFYFGLECILSYLHLQILKRFKNEIFQNILDILETYSNALKNLFGRFRAVFTCLLN